MASPTKDAAAAGITRWKSPRSMCLFDNSSGKVTLESAALNELKELGHRKVNNLILKLSLSRFVCVYIYIYIYIYIYVYMYIAPTAQTMMQFTTPLILPIVFYRLVPLRFSSSHI